MDSESQSQKGPQVLSSHGALAPGANLWIIPGFSDSEWCAKLDWYLNFQISKASHHKSKSCDSDFVKMMEQNDFEYHEPQKPKKDPLLMVACANRLPADMVVCVPFETDTGRWAKNIYEIWQQLTKPDIRIFLPFNFSTSQFNREWPDKNVNAKITLVTSQKTENH